MRIRMLLALSKPDVLNALPINYQYEFSSWFRKNFSNSHTVLNHYLQELGLNSDEAGFSYFTFSNPYIPKIHQVDDRIIIKSSAISIIFSTMDLPGLYQILYHHFINLEFVIGDPLSKVRFKIIEVKQLPEPEFYNEMEFKCISPILISKQKRVFSTLNIMYLHPEDPEYILFFKASLKRKIQNLVRINYLETNGFNYNNLEFALCAEKPKSRLITIKAHTPEESRIRGFMFNFKIKAPVEVLKSAYTFGFGELGSLGFGCAVPVAS